MAEEWGNNLILYLYDTDGSPIGMQYRNTSYAEGVFDTYWYEKNLQGDVVMIWIILRFKRPFSVNQRFRAQSYFLFYRTNILYAFLEMNITAY